MHDYLPSPRSSIGVAIVLHHNARNVVVDGNEIFNSNLAASVGAHATGDVGVVAFRWNRIRDMQAVSGQRDTGSGLRISPAATAHIYHNTFHGLPGEYAVKLGGAGVGPVGHVHIAGVINNIFQLGSPQTSMLSIDLGNVAALTSDRNILFGGHPQPISLMGAGRSSWRDWQTTRNQDCSSLPNQTNPSSDPVLAHPDLTPGQSSPARDRALDLTFRQGRRRICGSAFDIGAVEACP